MKAKEYLRDTCQKIKDIRARTETKKERLARIESILTSPAVGELKRDKIQTSLDLRKQENMVIEKEALRAEIGRMLQSEAELLVSIGKKIDGMETGLYARILHLKYEEQRTLAEIADIIHYSYDRTAHLHGYALQEFTKIYGNDIL